MSKILQITSSFSHIPLLKIKIKQNFIHVIADILLAFSELELQSSCDGKSAMAMPLAALIGKELAFKHRENLMLQFVLESHTHSGSVCQALYADSFQRARFATCQHTHTERDFYN